MVFVIESVVLQSLRYCVIVAQVVLLIVSCFPLCDFIVKCI